MTYLAYQKEYGFYRGAYFHKQWDLPTSTNAMRASDLLGIRIGILGHGSISRPIGRVASAMGMEMLALTRTPKDTAQDGKDASYALPRLTDTDGNQHRRSNQSGISHSENMLGVCHRTIDTLKLKSGATVMQRTIGKVALALTSLIDANVV